MIYCEYSYARAVKCTSKFLFFFVFCILISNCFGINYWKDCPFFFELLVHLCQKSIDLCGSVSTVWFIHLILMIIPQSWLLLLEVRKVYSVSSSTIFLFIKVILAVLGPLHFCINFRTSYSISTIKPDRILVRIARMDRLIQEN